MRQYQIVVKEAGSDRWAFVAHGAAYSKDEAEEWKARAVGRKASVKFLPVKP